MQVKIFANKNTNEKVAIACPDGFNRHVQLSLNEKLGGSWVLVDGLNPGEGIVFKDDQTYKGFRPDIERYSTAIVKVA